MKNQTICISGRGHNKDFSCLITDNIPDLGMIGLTQAFPMWIYKETDMIEILEQMRDNGAMKLEALIAGKKRHFDGRAYVFWYGYLEAVADMCETLEYEGLMKSVDEICQQAEERRKFKGLGIQPGNGAQAE